MNVSSLNQARLQSKLGKILNQSLNKIIVEHYRKSLAFNWTEHAKEKFFSNVSKLKLIITNCI